MLIYNAQGHAFWNGKRVPRTTEICNLLAPRFPCDPWYLERGRIGHLITQYHDQGELDYNSVDPSLRGRFNAHRKFCEEVNPIIELIEITLYHPTYKYCGKPDRYGIIFRWHSVWDIKFGAPAEADSYQLPAYLFLLRVNGYPAEKCFDVYLKDSGDYRVKEIKRPSILFSKFLEGIQKWKEENNGNGS